MLKRLVLMLVAAVGCFRRSQRRTTPTCSRGPPQTSRRRCRCRSCSSASSLATSRGRPAWRAAGRRRPGGALARSTGSSSGSGSTTRSTTAVLHGPAWEDSLLRRLAALARPRPTPSTRTRTTTTRRTSWTSRTTTGSTRRAWSTADRHAPAGVDTTRSPRSSSSTGGAGRTSAPRLLQDRRAGSRHGLRLRHQPRQPQDRRAGAARRRTTRRPASADRGVNRVWFYDLSAGPRTGAAATTSTTPTSTATASPTTASRRRGSTAATGRRRAAARPRQGRPLRRRSTSCSPARRCTRRTSRPTAPGRVDLDINTLEGWRRRRVERVHQAGAVPAGGARAADRLGRDATSRTCRSPATSTLLRGALPRGRRCCYPSLDYPPDANLFLTAASKPTRSSRATATTRPAWSTTRSATTDARRRSATPTTTGSTARRAACSASSRRASSRPATA